MGLISSKQIDFSDGISGSYDITGSFVVSGSLTISGAGSASLSYLSASGNIVANTGSFGNIQLDGDMNADNITAIGDINTSLSASSFIFLGNDQALDSVTPSDGQLMIYTASAFTATNRIDGGVY